MGFLVKGVKSVVKAVGSVVKSVVGIASKVVGAVFGFSTGKKTTAKAKSANTLNKSLDPETFRKIVLGAPAAPLDVRFWEVWGATGSNYDEVLALAGHRINAVKELYFEDALGFDAAGNAQGKYIGVVSRAVNLGTVGQAALAVGSGTQWTAAATFDYCAHIKLAWVPDEKKLPNGIPSRYTQVVEGALVYDPRRDSTRGGSGSHRADDNSTWSYATLDANGQPIGRNNALQALWYLLGWTVLTKDANGNVNGSALVCGRGVDPQDINMSTFIAGANACEAAGYYTDLVLSTEDTHTSNEDKITCDGLIGRLMDPGGLWSYYANVNDTANVAVELTDADIIQGTSVTWDEYKPMSEQYNQVSGKYINPSATTLYQAFPYPMVRDAVYEAALGTKRRKPQDFEQVLDGTLAQRLARLLLNEGQYQGEFQAGFNYRALKAQAWSVVRYTSDRFGWSKLFRVYRYDLSTSDGIGMLLREIDPSIWSAGTVNPPVAPGAGRKYDPNMQVVVTGLAVAQYAVYGPGANPSIADGANISWNAPPINVRRTELRYRVVGTSYWETVAPILRGTATNVIIFPLVSGAQYEIQIRHITIHEIEGNWQSFNPNFQVGAQGNITYAGIVNASGTAVWNNITGTGKPANNADVTSANVASGITNQGYFATQDYADWFSRVTGVGKPESYATSGTNLIVDAKRIGNAVVRNDFGNASVVIERDGITSGPNRDNNRIRHQAGNNAVWFGDPVPVVPGETIYVGAEISQLSVNGTCYLYVSFYKGDGSELSGLEVVNTRIGASQVAAGNWINVNSNFVVPATAATMRFGSARDNNGNSGYWYVANPFFGRHQPGATLGADVSNNLLDGGVLLSRSQVITNLGIASGIASQGAFATLNNAAYGSTLLTGFGSLASMFNVYYGSSYLLESAGGAQATLANFKTASGIASGIINQSAWATYSSNLPAKLEGIATGAGSSLVLNLVGTATKVGNTVGRSDASGVFTGMSAYSQTLQGAVSISGVYRGGLAWFGLSDVATPSVFADSDFALYIDQNNLSFFRDGDLIVTGLGAYAVGAYAVGDFFEVKWDRTVFKAFKNGIQVGPDISASTVLAPLKGHLMVASNGQISDLQFNNDNDRARTVKFDDTGRVNDPTAYNTQFILGPASASQLSPSYSVGSSNVTINLPSHTRYIAGKTGPIGLSYGAMSAVWGFSSYWTAYIDDPNLTGIASPTVVLTSNPNDLLVAGRYQVASGITPDANNTGGTTGGGGGTGRTFDNCVAADSFIPDLYTAGTVQPGDMLLVVDYGNFDLPTRTACTANGLAEADCVELVSVSGIRLILSKTTPCTLYGGKCVEAADAAGYELAVQDADGFRWEKIVDVNPAGVQVVAHISCNNGTYAAGAEPGRYIFTHNIYAKP